MTDDRYRWLAIHRLVTRFGVGAAATVAYLLTASRWVVGGDSAEFSTLFATGGAAHPPGYPLYVLYLRALSWIPCASPAHGAALATALLGGLAVYGLNGACRSWGASAAASGLAASVFALSPVAWRLATEAEVFAGNAAIAAFILWAAAPSLALAPQRRVAILGLLAGVGVAHHHTIVLLAPIGLLSAVRAVRAAERPAAAAAVGSGAFLLASTLPYLYTASVARRALDPARWSWGGIHDFGSFLHFFRRGEYGTTSLVIGGEYHPLDQVMLLAKGLTSGLFGLPIVVLAAAGLALLGRGRRFGAATRADGLALVGSFLLAGPLLVAAFKVALTGSGPAMVARFYLLPSVLVCHAAALAFDVPAGLSPALRRVVAAGGCAAAFEAHVALTAPDLALERGATLETYLENTLRSAPPRAIVLGTGDARFGGFAYARYALGLRPDVTFINPPLLFTDWYFERSERAAGFPLVAPVQRKLSAVAFVGGLLQHDRPVLVTDLFVGELATAFPSYPVGTLVRVVPRGAPVPDAPALEEINLALVGTFDDGPTAAPPPGAAEGGLRMDYGRPWRSLAEAFARRGDGDGVQRNLERARLAEGGAFAAMGRRSSI